MITDEDVERVARAMCAEARENPEQLVYMGAPVLVHGGGYVTTGPGYPAWQLRARSARAAITETMAILEERGQ